jgi:hypothetical protein
MDKDRQLRGKSLQRTTAQHTRRLRITRKPNCLPLSRFRAVKYRRAAGVR